VKYTFKHFPERRSIEEVFSGFPVNPEAIYEYENEFLHRALKELLIIPQRCKRKHNNYLFPYMYRYNSLYSKNIKLFMEHFLRETYWRYFWTILDFNRRRNFKKM
jgi:hypothetical protein